MSAQVLLIMPPFAQLNAVYPSLPVLSGFLKQHNYSFSQIDLSIEVINLVFSRNGLGELFSEIENKPNLSDNSRLIISNKETYISTIQTVINFVQGNDLSLAQRICNEMFLPRASRFNQLAELEWAFGAAGIIDKAKYFATLYLEDLGDLINETITPFFGFSRYAEKISLSVADFSSLEKYLNGSTNLIERILLNFLNDSILKNKPNVIGISIPFPGNLYAALLCGRFIKNNFPDIKVIFGGGYVNTELRQMTEIKIFDYCDFITLDDGERPLLNILEYIKGVRTIDSLKRTFIKENDKIRFIDSKTDNDFKFKELPAPDFSGLLLDKYISTIEIPNPVHRLWSDGKWNKMAIAHGCYWRKCAFCDTSLDYISRFDSVDAQVIVDKIETVMAQTKQTGFHFVDEAAPPAVLKAMALELLKRQIHISWWTNIRFERAFTADVCRLLALSGCIAVTGGMETASDRLLKLMNKGITIEQAALTCRNFAESGILVHTYLMYGFPTQTEQETVNSLEIVRQFFENELIQSAFWHLFTATVHSDVGMNPEKYNIKITSSQANSFANNGLEHIDLTNQNHSKYSFGLTKALYNYLHGIGFDFPLTEWFDFPIPKVTVPKNLILRSIENSSIEEYKPDSVVVWIENKPTFEEFEYSKKGKIQQKIKLTVYGRFEKRSATFNFAVGKWLKNRFESFYLSNADFMKLKDLKLDFQQNVNQDFDLFMKSNEWITLCEMGILII